MNGALKIAVLGNDVYMLYMSEMAPDSRFLLCLLTFKRPKNRGLALQYCNESPFSSTMRFGKKHALFGFMKQPQDIVAMPPSLKSEIR